MKSQKDLCKVYNDIAQLVKNRALKHHDERKEQQQIDWDAVPDFDLVDLQGVNFSQDDQ